jgi:putative FmdB family regulatory protein
LLKPDKNCLISAIIKKIIFLKRRTEQFRGEIKKKDRKMPIYEYKCTQCNEEFEMLVFGNKNVDCPKCMSPEVKKKLSVFGMSGVEKPFAGSSSGCTSCSKGTCGSCK